MEPSRSPSGSPKSSSSQSSNAGESIEEEGMQDCVSGAADEKDLVLESTPPGSEKGIMTTVPSTDNNPRQPLTPLDPNLQPMQPHQKIKRRIVEVCLLNILYYYMASPLTVLLRVA